MIFRRHRGWTGIALFTDQRHSTTHYTIWLHLIRNPLVLPAAVASRPWAARRSRLKWPLDGRKMSVNRDMSRSCTETLIAQWKRILYIHLFLLAASTAAKINHEPNSWWITWQWNGWLIFQMLCKIPLPSFTWLIYLSFNLEEWICYHLVRSYFEVAPKIPQKDPRGSMESMVQLTWNCWWTKSILFARSNE